MRCAPLQRKGAAASVDAAAPFGFSVTSLVFQRQISQTCFFDFFRFFPDFSVRSSVLLNQQALSGHLLRLLLTHDLDQGGNDVRQAAALSQGVGGIVVHQNERNLIRRWRPDFMVIG